jgi:VWFA-related protein
MLLRVPIFAVALTFGTPVFAGQRHTPPPEHGPIFRLGVSLVQLDVVVTDRRGRHVHDLGPADFEVLQNGRPQPIVDAIYVQQDRASPAGAGSPQGAQIGLRSTGIGHISALAPSAAGDIGRRVLAILVDDARMSFAGIYFTRDALLRFVADDFRHGDLAGLIRSSGGRSPETLTSGREELAQSIRRLSFRDARALVASDEILGRYCVLPWLAARLDALLVNRLLGRMHDVVETLRPLPGRKAIVLVSEGFWSGDDRQRGLQDLVDSANRCGVAIYAVDPRGLEIPCGADGEESLHSCYAQLNTRDALHFLAAETGGFAVVNTSNLRGGLERIANDQRGYYLVGYQPEVDTFRNAADPEYLKVKVAVKRKGLKVRSRRGFYAVPTQ